VAEAKIFNQSRLPSNSRKNEKFIVRRVIVNLQQPKVVGHLNKVGQFARNNDKFFGLLALAISPPFGIFARIRA
jgi:hypothetical protein